MAAAVSLRRLKTRQILGPGPLQGLLLAGLFMVLAHASVQAAPAGGAGRTWSFGILGQPPRMADGEAHLRQALEASQQERLAFVVASGIKSAAEPCSDALYEARLELLEQSRQPVFLSLSAPDWAECRREDGRSAAQERLARVRDLFFANVGRNPALAVAQQSQIAQYRDFAENLRWEMRGVMFATINLPGDNNHYVPDAGRNSEFEDRMIANRHWLQRLLHAAKNHRAPALVLFFDADPQLWHVPRPGAGQRDGYAEVRRQLRELGSKFNGKLLLVHQGDGRGKPGLRWRGNVGELVPWPGLTRVSVQSRGTNFQAVEVD